jgi:hypothetical protein
LGPYDQRKNGCVDHVAETLRAGGAEVPSGGLGQYKYLKGWDPESMALVRCPLHGDQVAAFVSKSVAVAAVDPGSVQPETVVVTLNYGNAMESRHDVDASMLEGLRAAGLLEYGSLNVSSEVESLEIFCELAPVCRICLSEWRTSKAPK